MGKNFYRGLVDTNAAALDVRINFNSKAHHNLETWILSQLAANIDNIGSVLDLGCGTGKQLKALSQALPKTTFLGVDISAEALSNIPTDERVKTLCCSFDDPSKIKGTFDLIISTYAIYYSYDMVETIKTYRDKLNTNGEIFVLGPAKGTNKEFIDLVNSTHPGIMIYVENFIDNKELNSLAEHFSSTSVKQLNNNIKFTSADEVIDWWRNHNSYMPEIENEVYQTLQKQNTFNLTKNVLGIHFFR